MNVQCHSCIGGKSISEDIRRLDYGVQVVSGTPGRVFDMIQRKHLRTRNLKMLVIDEADEMLNQGFKEQIYDIYRYLPPTTQVVLVSATLPQEVLDMTKKFMNEPIRVLVKRDELTLEGIKQVCKVFCSVLYSSHLNTISFSSSWQWRRKNGSSTPCATCTIHSQ